MKPGAQTTLRYRKGRLVVVESAVKELAWDLAPRRLPRPFSGTVFCRLVPLNGKLCLFGDSYILDSTPLMNAPAKRSMLEALGFAVSNWQYRFVPTWCTSPDEELCSRGMLFERRIDKKGNRLYRIATVQDLTGIFPNGTVSAHGETVWDDFGKKRKK